MNDLNWNKYFELLVNDYEYHRDNALDFLTTIPTISSEPIPLDNTFPSNKKRKI